MVHLLATAQWMLARTIPARFTSRSGNKTALSGAVVTAADPPQLDNDSSTSRLKLSAMQLELLNDEQSPLLKLPAEIRDLIYRHAVVSHPYHKIEVVRRGHKADLTNARHPLALVCHRLRQEVSPIFYAENIFYFNNFSTHLRLRASDIQHFHVLVGDMASKITNVKLHRRFFVYVGQSFSCYMRFEIRLTDVGLHVETLSGKPSAARVERYENSSPESMDISIEPCYCQIVRIAEQSYAAGMSETPILDFLERYARLINTKTTWATSFKCHACRYFTTEQRDAPTPQPRFMPEW